MGEWSGMEWVIPLRLSSRAPAVLKTPCTILRQFEIYLDNFEVPLSQLLDNFKMILAITRDNLWMTLRQFWDHNWRSLPLLLSDRQQL